MTAFQKIRVNVNDKLLVCFKLPLRFTSAGRGTTTTQPPFPWLLLCTSKELSFLFRKAEFPQTMTRRDLDHQCHPSQPNGSEHGTGDRYRNMVHTLRRIRSGGLSRVNIHSMYEHESRRTTSGSRRSPRTFFRPVRRVLFGGPDFNAVAVSTVECIERRLELTSARSGGR